MVIQDSRYWFFSAPLRLCGKIMYFGCEGVGYLCSRTGRSREGHGCPRATLTEITASNGLRWGESKREATKCIFWIDTKDTEKSFSRTKEDLAL